jgi:hypothetical protein
MFAVAQSGELGACCPGDWLILTDWLFFSIRDILLIAYSIETICSGQTEKRKKSAAGLKASARG